VKQYTDEQVDGPLHLWLHPGTDGAFSLYEDDGHTFDFRKGEFMKLDLVWNDRRRALNVRLATGSKMLGSEKRNFVVHVAGESQTREAVFEGRAAEIDL
jgi:alpha-glucosidase (family GH31 glycosyl hydrolase)